MIKRLLVASDPCQVVDKFDGVRCIKDHKHQIIEGQEGGESRSKFAACYPAPMCEALVDAFELFLLAS